jgi:hypothetical protein
MLNERQLWAAVLVLAFKDLRDTKTGNRTRLWFASGRYEPGSFLWICESLELNAMEIRLAAMRNREASRQAGGGPELGAGLNAD